METNRESSAQTLTAWYSIWWRPQATIKALLRRDVRTTTLILAALAGIATTIGIGSMAPNLHWFALTTGAVLIGSVFGLLALYVEGALLAWTGRPLGGRASQSALRMAIAWAELPNVAALLIILATFAVFHQEFLRAYARVSGLGSPILDAVIVVLALLSLWAILLRVRTVGAVQQFGLVRSVTNVAAVLLMMAAAALSIRTFLFQPFVISAGSMEPALRIGDYVFVDKRSYGYSRYSFPIDARFEGRLGGKAPARGDLIVFKLPSDPRIDYVKRIIGLPGDEILMEGGVLHLNGKPVPKQRSADFASSSWHGANDTILAFEESLPEGKTITVLDSEPDGPFDTAGPFRVPAGHYFVMGDNRDNSVDSRDPQQVALIPADLVVGRVSLIYFSADEPRETESIANAFANIRWSRMFLAPE
ncbi:signal peptidase I [Hyphomicrobium sp. CS1GBMeth3]|uniref:signal peptidase I n=1 Tax=Hyphomicrobium sp. CS1GBMeth3 TaxID=1892845 RepID=UPI000A77C107|nr:signal peptidase I [Hyphomicrobium sp. CS1GBMeth3]